MINFNKCPFLSFALNHIKQNPGCSKRDIIYAYGGHNRYGVIPSRSYSYRNAAISRLLSEGFVKDKSCSLNQYSLFAK